ncbi:MAG: hypothetical protein K2X39_00395 [Silvanigrellaceae bacterium]|nr:hypothetical protein [Silvanigrellaceae bacterium]
MKAFKKRVGSLALVVSFCLLTTTAFSQNDSQGFTIRGENNVPGPKDLLPNSTPGYLENNHFGDPTLKIDPMAQMHMMMLYPEMMTGVSPESYNLFENSNVE